jgi:hypothetical protein
VPLWCERKQGALILSIAVVLVEAFKALTERGPRDLHAKTESELLQLPNGFFWVALARAIRPEQADEAREYPQRERRQVKSKGYVNFTTAIQGSSSPIGSSSSEFEVDIEDVDEDEHEARWSKRDGASPRR